MIPLTDKENKSYEVQKVWHICKNKFSDNDDDDDDDDDGVFDDDDDDDDNKKHQKVRDHCHYTRKCRGAAHNTSYTILRK